MTKLPALYDGNERFPPNYDYPANDLNRIPLRRREEFTANRIAALDDCGRVNHMNVAGANTYTIPPNSSVPFPMETSGQLAA
jgi:hypothetical protein